MGYCTTAEVQSFFRKINISATTLVSTTEVTAWIDQYSAYADSRLSELYITPITGTESTKVMKLIVSKFVAGEVDRILRESKAVIDEKKRAKDLISEAEALLNKLASAESLLSDAKALNPAVITSYTSQNSIAPVMTKEKEF